MLNKKNVVQKENMVNGVSGVLARKPVQEANENVKEFTTVPFPSTWKQKSVVSNLDMMIGPVGQHVPPHVEEVLKPVPEKEHALTMTAKRKVAENLVVVLNTSGVVGDLAQQHADSDKDTNIKQVPAQMANPWMKKLNFVMQDRASTIRNGQIGRNVRGPVVEASPQDSVSTPVKDFWRKKNLATTDCAHSLTTGVRGETALHNAKQE